MSKYYCKYCGADWSPGGSTLHIDYELKYCLFCGGPDIKGKRKSVVRVPKFETPKQYKERTGKEWPMGGPVWVFQQDIIKIGGMWRLRDLWWHETYANEAIVVCANGPDKPSADWKPEEKEE